LTEEKKAKSAAPREPRFRSILFICAANTARSVMAEHILRRELDALGFDHNIVQLHQILGVKLRADGASGMPLRPDWEPAEARAKADA